MLKTETSSLAGMSSADKRALARQLLRDKAEPGAVALRRIAPGNGGQPGSNREISPELYRFDLYPSYRKLEEYAEVMRAIGISNPYFNAHQDVSNNTITIEDREYINYSGYNYLGLSGDTEVTAAAKDAIDRYGTSVSASRIVSGEIPLHRELEQELAGILGVEGCTVFVSGYGTNVSTISHLFGPKDLILHDSLIHNSLMTGCVLSGARRIPFPHNDSQALARLLEENRHYYERVLIVIEGVYSMDGDIPHLPSFIQIKKQYKAFLMVDEAHSIGVLGPQGFGIGEHFGVIPKDVDIWMGTLSKAFASCGGYIAGGRALIENLRYNAPGGILYSVGISPANAGAALASIRKMVREPERVKRLRARAKLFLTLARSRGLDTGPSAGSAVVPVILRDSILSLKLSHNLFERGINVQAVLYPAVPEDEARLRFFISTLHTEAQIRDTVDAVADELEYLRGRRQEPTPPSVSKLGNID
jgi:8-amino-7-oxononanoate synthase